MGSFSYSGATSGSTTYSLTLSPTLSADILAGNTASLRMFAGDSAVSYLFDFRSFGHMQPRGLFSLLMPCRNLATAPAEPPGIGFARFLAQVFGRSRK